MSPHLASDVGKAVEAIAKHCSQLQELWLGCPYRVRDDLLKNLIYNSFVSLKKVCPLRKAHRTQQFTLIILL